MKSSFSLLPNGLGVLTVPLKGRASASAGVWVRVGGRHEEKRVCGISHFLEHLLFKGTKTRDVRRIKEEVEGKGGTLNAFTAEEFTCYYAKMPERRLFEALDVLADMVENALLAGTDIRKERTVVIEEIRMTQDQPAQLAEEMLDALFFGGHALGRPLTGTLESIRAMDRADLVAWRDRAYVPGLMTLVAAGDLDPARIVRFARSRFRGRRPAPRLPDAGPPPPRRAVRIAPKRIEQVHVALAVPGLPKGHPREHALGLLNVVLGGNMSSRLFNEVREERGLAYDVSSGTKRYRDTGALLVEAGVDPAKAEDAVRAILRECARLAKSPVGAAELRRAKDYTLGQFVTGLDGSLDVMLWAGEEYLSRGRLRSLAEIEAAVERVRPAEIRDLARALFRDASLNAVILGPVSKQRVSRLPRTFSFSI